MRRLCLALALFTVSVALPARADDDDDDAPEAPAAHANAQPIACGQPAGLKGDAAAAYGPACSFLMAVAAREPAALTMLVHSPFYFEGKPVTGRDEILKRWTTLLGDLRGARSALYGLDLYTLDEMTKKFGKPPAKLEGVPLRGALIAVGNLDGRATVLALRKDGPQWTVFAFHD